MHLAQKLYNMYSYVLTSKKSLSNTVEDMKMLAAVTHAGYDVTNPDKFMHSANVLLVLISLDNKLDMHTLLKSFGKNTELQAYTDEDWFITLYVYSLIFGWVDEFEEIFGVVPQRQEVKEFKEQKESKLKPITIIFKEDLYEITKEILESKTMLRREQIDLLKLMPVDVFNQDFSINFRATEAVLTKILIEKDLIPNIKSADELMRYILLLNGESLELASSQITKNSLKEVKFHISTSKRKDIWNILNKSNIQIFVEDMYRFENFWKRALKHLKFTSLDKMQIRYKNISSLFNLLYSKDRKWTFNSRYEEALKKDITKAGVIASERPNFFLRNFATLSQGSIDSNTLDKVLSKATNKQILQTIEVLSQKPGIKYVRGQTLERKPIENAVALRSYIYNVLKLKLNIEGTYKLDESLKDIPLVFSGTTDTRDTLSGNYVAPYQKIQIPKTAKFLRIGVAWKDIGNGSCDIDLHCLYIKEDMARHSYYNEPEVEIEGKIIGRLSGDVTHCNTEYYSAEFYDFDLKAEYDKILYYTQMYSGLELDKYDTHVFIKFLEAEDRVMDSNDTKVDLSKQDYACKITPIFRANRTILGILEDSKFQFIGEPDSSSTDYDSSSVQDGLNIIDSLPIKLNYYDVLSNVLSISEDGKLIDLNNLPNVL